VSRRFKDLWRSVALCVATGTAAASRLVWLSAKYYLYSVTRVACVRLGLAVPFPIRIISAHRCVETVEGRGKFSARGVFVALIQPVRSDWRRRRARAHTLEVVSTRVSLVDQHLRILQHGAVECALYIRRRAFKSPSDDAIEWRGRIYLCSRFCVRQRVNTYLYRASVFFF